MKPKNATWNLVAFSAAFSIFFLPLNFLVIWHTFYFGQRFKVKFVLYFHRYFLGKNHSDLPNKLSHFFKTPKDYCYILLKRFKKVKQIHSVKLLIRIPGWLPDFGRLFHSISDSTQSTGLAAIKMTALGRPNLLVSPWADEKKSRLKVYTGFATMI